ncbi:hypothetical protein DYU11_32335 [Fibrisoma montanum]|uniref:Uncharacterized protein n=1 Tax=Fibrisoma montanum TaxID=2305895 RepID=A0A418LVZ7_9BACT|nr:hypothetical protein [Fibrisoma montanum]RIV17379.1 hypothetical protein DYU11_32335 [Fibrisoma montanum]
MALTSKNPETVALIERMDDVLDSDIHETTPKEGVQLIDEWLNVLENNGLDSTDAIVDILEELRAQLDPQAVEQPNTGRITSLLQDLIDQTQQVARSAEASAEEVELQQLIATLESLHRQLADTSANEQ